MIYDTIKELRQKAGLSQSELAKRLNVTRSSVNAWEMGISVPSTQYVVEMSQIFNVSTDYLLGLKNEQHITLDGLTEEEINVVYSLIECFKRSKEK